MAQRTLDHTSICVADVARSRQFYEGLLGLTPAERPDFPFPGMWYQLGEGQLHLIQREQVATSRNSGDMINAADPHFAIQVDDLDAMRHRAKAAGLELLEFGGEQLWVRDPDGNTVELRSPAGPPR
jgi:glyoxylase I family protein